MSKWIFQTAEEFIEALPRDGWMLDDCGRVRRKGMFDDRHMCPLQKGFDGGPSIMPYLQRFVAGADAVADILRAADNVKWITNPELRAFMLKHFNLEESK